MDKKDIKKFEKVLSQESKRITKELKTIAKEDTRPKGDFDTRFPEWGQSPDKNALEVTMYEKTLPVEFTLELRLKEIEEALEKIKKGQYGLCQACQKVISLARLEALPEAKLCLDCVKKKTQKS